ncbi:MAG: hypothetical protein ABIH50_02980 [bacterium]
MPRTKYPKLRAWGKPTRKVMTMVIPSKKEKLAKRAAIKKQTREEVEKTLKEK